MILGTGATVPIHYCERCGWGSTTQEHSKEVRTFESGATRSSDANKPDYEGYLSPLVIWCFGQYMTKHRIQANGAVRPSDNWQRGIPKEEYIKSAWRHFEDVLLHHDGYPDYATESLEDALCALFFNVQGYLHEYLRAKVAVREMNVWGEVAHHIEHTTSGGSPACGAPGVPR